MIWESRGVYLFPVEDIRGYCATAALSLVYSLGNLDPHSCRAPRPGEGHVELAMRENRGR